MFPYLKVCLIYFMEKLMTNNNSQENAQQLFCASDAYKSLTTSSRLIIKPDDFIVVFNDVFQLVTGNTQASFIERAPLLIKKINDDLSWRKVYIELIQQLKFASSGLQAAASSGEILPSRITEHFMIKFKRDINHPTQVYVILTINHPAAHHLTHDITIHVSRDEQVDCLYFPILNDGRSQLLMNDDDTSFMLLTDEKSELFLM